MTDSGIVDIVSVLIDKIHWRIKGFSDCLKERKTCLVLNYCFMITEGRRRKEKCFGIKNIGEEC